MCGIAGFCKKNIDNQREILHMCQQMIERGPDAAGYFVDERTGVTLGHRRLSIMDLSENGAQPMTSHNGRYVISYNGEIYNAEDMKNRLISAEKVVQFRGTSDTEILLEAIHHYGIECIKDLKGMFAIALYDREEKKLQLIRDRVGEKPLYYGYVGGAFAFASDIKVLKAMSGFQNTINRDAMASFIRLGYMKRPETIYEGIYQLEPGTILTIKAPFLEDYQLESYWSMAEVAKYGQENPFMGNEKEALTALEKVLAQAVEGQMVSDVPIGAFLSGGIDSPLIVSLMQQFSKNPVKTFTIGFQDKRYNEAEFAKDIAKHLGTDHTELYVTERELQEVIPKLPDIFTEPFADSSQIPTYLVSKLARSKVTVSLSGDAGDELFCGYNTYYKCQNLWNKVNKIPYGIRNLGGMGISNTPFVKNSTAFRVSQCLQAKNNVQLQEAVCNRMDYYADHMIIGGNLSLNQEIPLLKDSKTAMLYKDMMGYHPDDILTKVDRAGMAVSLENRVPMLDRDVIELAWQLPIAYKYQDGISKKILKDMLYQYVPKEMLDRPKKGFSVPIKEWLTEGFVADMAADYLVNSHLIRDGYVDKKNFETVWMAFKKSGEHSKLIWKLFMAEQWYQNWM